MSASAESPPRALTSPRAIGGYLLFAVVVGGLNWVSTAGAQWHSARALFWTDLVLAAALLAVPFRRRRSLIETGAADFVFRLLYYGLGQLLQALTSPHSVNLHLRCALEVVQQVICVGYRLTYRGNAMVGHEEDRFVAEDLGKALAFRGIKSWASVIVVICNHFHHPDFRLADLFNVGIFETDERTGKRHMRVEHGFGLRQRLVNWRVNAIAGPLDVTVPALHLAIVDAYLHERRSLDLRPVHAKRNLVIAVGLPGTTWVR